MSGDEVQGWDPRDGTRALLKRPRAAAALPGCGHRAEAASAPWTWAVTGLALGPRLQTREN